MRISKPFEKQGGYTEFDNDILDHIMPSLKPSEWMVLCFIIRKTKGWHKESDAIAYSQFIKGTGIGSNSTIKKCLDNLVAKGMVLVGTTGNKADAHHYMLNKNYSFGITETVERPVTFSVERPVTETVDTKESFKEKESNPPALEIVAYQNAFGAKMNKEMSDMLYDDIDEFGIMAVINTINEAKGKGINNYKWVAAVLKGRANDKRQKQSADDILEMVLKASQNKTLKNLPEPIVKAVRKVGESRIREVKPGYEMTQLKKELYQYAQ